MASSSVPSGALDFSKTDTYAALDKLEAFKNTPSKATPLKEGRNLAGCVIIAGVGAAALLTLVALIVNYTGPSDVEFMRTIGSVTAGVCIPTLIISTVITAVMHGKLHKKRSQKEMTEAIQEGIKNEEQLITFYTKNGQTHQKRKEAIEALLKKEN